jgi:small-conductance mechanosensitive channel
MIKFIYDQEKYDQRKKIENQNEVKKNEKQETAAVDFLSQIISKLLNTRKKLIRKKLLNTPRLTEPLELGLLTSIYSLK